jgi:hypothetical protein
VTPGDIGVLDSFGGRDALYARLNEAFAAVNAIK